MKTVSFILTIYCCLMIELLTAQAPVRTGKDYAVFFYMTDFKDRQWTSLPETKGEVEAITRELENNYGFEVELIRNPTKENILDKITQVNKRQFKHDDQVLFFFSTHGYYDSLQDEGFLIPFDGKVEDTYGDTWLSYANLGRRITTNSSGHVMLALDACYSGAFGRRNATRGKPTGMPQDEDVDCRTKAKRALKYKSRLYFSSGSKEQRTPAQSPFASRWLEVLRKGEELGIVRTDDLRYYLSRIDFPRPEDGTFINHEENGDFIFVHQSACLSQPPVSETRDTGSDTLIVSKPSTETKFDSIYKKERKIETDKKLKTGQIKIVTNEKSIHYLRDPKLWVSTRVYTLTGDPNKDFEVNALYLETNAIEKKIPINEITKLHCYYKGQDFYVEISRKEKETIKGFLVAPDLGALLLVNRQVPITGFNNHIGYLISGIDQYKDEVKFSLFDVSSVEFGQ